MRKLLVIAVILFGFSGLQQVKGQEIGVRFGNGLVSDVAFDAVFSFGQFSRIHSNVAFGNDQVGVSALLDFIYRPLGEEGFSWYTGAGPYVALGGDFQLGAAGEIGLEYQFGQVPLSLSLDWRPAFRLVDDTDFSVDGFGFNLRYVFKSKERD
ncbi:outer membrane insertion C- signal [Roseivirga misakiensis]|uniref:Outer membrane insertion C-signal n=1 Tax=Roseivirga misakiensis TaxID=1563681 RepID=A0A1E5SLE5_9BACT|nr:outer membrane insertion C- signal [Roseivirga misakiensis]OEJ99947.1 outer membrane insertion C- signal [Roseivirga misakiensis]